MPTKSSKSYPEFGQHNHYDTVEEKDLKTKMHNAELQHLNRWLKKEHVTVSKELARHTRNPHTQEDNESHHHHHHHQQHHHKNNSHNNNTFMNNDSSQHISPRGSYQNTNGILNDLMRNGHGSVSYASSHSSSSHPIQRNNIRNNQSGYDPFYSNKTMTLSSATIRAGLHSNPNHETNHNPNYEDDQEKEYSENTNIYKSDKENKIIFESNIEKMQAIFYQIGMKILESMKYLNFTIKDLIKLFLPTLNHRTNDDHDGDGYIFLNEVFSVFKEDLSIDLSGTEIELISSLQIHDQGQYHGMIDIIQMFSILGLLNNPLEDEERGGGGGVVLPTHRSPQVSQQRLEEEETKYFKSQSHEQQQHGHHQHHQQQHQQQHEHQQHHQQHHQQQHEPQPKHEHQHHDDNDDSFNHRWTQVSSSPTYKSAKNRYYHDVEPIQQQNHNDKNDMNDDDDAFVRFKVEKHQADGSVHRRDWNAKLTSSLPSSSSSSSSSFTTTRFNELVDPMSTSVSQHLDEQHKRKEVKAKNKIMEQMLSDSSPKNNSGDNNKGNGCGVDSDNDQLKDPLSDPLSMIEENSVQEKEECFDKKETERGNELNESDSIGLTTAADAGDDVVMMGTLRFSDTNPQSMSNDLQLQTDKEEVGDDDAMKQRYNVRVASNPSDWANTPKSITLHAPGYEPPSPSYGLRVQAARHDGVVGLHEKEFASEVLKAGWSGFRQLEKKLSTYFDETNKQTFVSPSTLKLCLIESGIKLSLSGYRELLLGLGYKDGNIDAAEVMQAAEDILQAQPQEQDSHLLHTPQQQYHGTIPGPPTPGALANSTLPKQGEEVGAAMELIEQVSLLPALFMASKQEVFNYIRTPFLEALALHAEYFKQNPTSHAEAELSKSGLVTLPLPLFAHALQNLGIEMSLRQITAIAFAFSEYESESDNTPHIDIEQFIDWLVTSLPSSVEVTPPQGKKGDYHGNNTTGGGGDGYEPDWWELEEDIAWRLVELMREGGDGFIEELSLKFIQADRQSKGSLNIWGIGNALEECGLLLSETELAALMKALRGGREANYGHILYFLRSQQKQWEEMDASIANQLLHAMGSTQDHRRGWLTNLKAEFDRVDSDLHGAMTTISFLKTLKNFGVNLSHAHGERLLIGLKITEEGIGLTPSISNLLTKPQPRRHIIYYKDFLKFIAQHTSLIPQHSQSKQPSSSTHQMNPHMINNEKGFEIVDENIVTLRNCLRNVLGRHSTTGDGSLSLIASRRLFDRCDVNGDGYLCFREFCDLCASVEFDQVATMTSAFRLIDSNDVGLISFASFMSFLSGIQSQENIEALYIQVISGIRDQLRPLPNRSVVIKRIGSMCELLDEDRDGRISAEDFMKALHSNQITIPIPHTQILTATLDKIGDNRLPWPSLVDELTKPRRLVGKFSTDKPSNNKQIPLQLVDYIRRLLCDHGIKLREELEICFRRYDSKRCGYLHVNHLWASIATVAPDIRLSISEQLLLTDCCQLNEKGEISIKEFINLIFGNSSKNNNNNSKHKNNHTKQTLSSHNLIDTATSPLQTMSLSNHQGSGSTMVGKSSNNPAFYHEPNTKTSFEQQQRKGGGRGGGPPTRNSYSSLAVNGYSLGNH